MYQRWPCGRVSWTRLDVDSGSKELLEVGGDLRRGSSQRGSWRLQKVLHISHRDLSCGAGITGEGAWSGKQRKSKQNKTTD